ncbi:GspH/FimT family pseudopilin [Immundisolibacter sp.]
MSKAGGFTLLEVLVVMALLAMVYALVPPMIRLGESATELKAAAREVAAALRKTRSLAITGRREAVLTLDTEARTFSLPGENKPRKLPQQMRISVFTAQGEVVDTHRAAIRFYPDGSSTGGRVGLSFSKRAFLIDIDWLSGEVVIREGAGA